MSIDPRALVTTGDNHTRTYAGKTFPNTPEGQAELAGHVSEVIGRREKLAGRTLTGKELAHGILDRPNDMDIRARQAAANWQPVKEPAPEAETNPYRRLMATGQHLPPPKPGQPMDRQAKMEELAERYDAQQAENAAADAHNTPQRERARRLAADAIERVLWDGTCPESAVILARQLQRQADDGDLSHFAEMHRTFRGKLAEQLQQRVAAIDQQAAELDAARAQLLGEEYEPAPQPDPAPSPPPSSVPPIVHAGTPEHDAIMASMRQTAERDAARKAAARAELYRHTGGR